MTIALLVIVSIGLAAALLVIAIAPLDVTIREEDTDE